MVVYSIVERLEMGVICQICHAGSGTVEEGEARGAAAEASECQSGSVALPPFVLLQRFLAVAFLLPRRSSQDQGSLVITKPSGEVVVTTAIALDPHPPSGPYPAVSASRSSALREAQLPLITSGA